MKSLQSDTVHPLYVLVGTEHILRRTFLSTLQARMQEQSGSSEEIAFDRFHFEENGCDGAVNACYAIGLFGDRSIVVLDHFNAVLSNAKAKHSTDALEAYVESPVMDRTFVIIVPGEKLDERKKLTKMLKKYPLVNCNTPKDAEAIEILKSMAKDDAITTAEDALAELWRRTLSISIALNELHKLHTYTAGETVKLADVQAVTAVPLEDNVFAWIDGVVKGNAAQAIAVLQAVQLAGYDTFALLAMVARQLRLMWYALTLGRRGMSAPQIAQQAGAHPYALRVAMEQSRGMSTEKIERIIRIVADAEYAMKTGRWEMSQALEWIVLSCSTISR